jgi:hypothetical protein
MIGQGEAGFGLGAVGSQEAGTLEIVAPSDRESEPDGALKLIFDSSELYLK